MNGGEKMIPEHETRKIFANNLSYLRSTRKQVLSQKALARILQLSDYTINNYENGKVAPSAYALYRVSRYFGITMECLLTMDLREINNLGGK